MAAHGRALPEERWILDTTWTDSPGRPQPCTAEAPGPTIGLPVGRDPGGSDALPDLGRVLSRVPMMIQACGWAP